MSRYSNWFLHCSLTFMALLPLGIIITGGEPLDYSPYKDPCPSFDIDPCMCFIDDMFYGGLTIDCSWVTSNDQLKEILSKDFPVTNFSSLSIQRNQNIKILKEGDLGDVLTFRRIEIIMGVLTRIEKNALIGSSDTLTYLSVSYNKIESVPDISVLPHLERLNMFESVLTEFPLIESPTLRTFCIGSPHIKELPVDAVKGLPLLESFQFEKNSITEVLPGTFANVEHLRYLSLLQNMLTTLPEDIRLHGNDTSLILIDNQITHLLYEAISDVTSELALDYNNMTELSEDIFRPLVEKSVGLFITNNPIDCGCDIAWLIVNQTLLHQLPGLDDDRLTPRCSNYTAFVDLDPEYYKENCPNVTSVRMDE